jgi:signal transduction histidine kinase
VAGRCGNIPAGLTALADAGMLSLIFQNLISNAIHCLIRKGQVKFVVKGGLEAVKMTAVLC